MHDIITVIKPRETIRETFGCKEALTETIFNKCQEYFNFNTDLRRKKNVDSNNIEISFFFFYQIQMQPF